MTQRWTSPQPRSVSEVSSLTEKALSWPAASCVAASVVMRAELALVWARPFVMYSTTSTVLRMSSWTPAWS